MVVLEKNINLNFQINNYKRKDHNEGSQGSQGNIIRRGPRGERRAEGA